MVKIAILGLGGVGGYLAAQATEYFSRTENNESVEFYYIARGEHLEAIKRDGLKLLRDGVEQVVARPYMVTDDITECGRLDYIIYATKSYSVESSIEQLRKVCDENTTIVTFMNGVDGAEKLRQALPKVKVSQGCVYIYSKILSAGVIAETGALAHYYVGDEALYELLSPAVDRITYHEDVELRIWLKFAYISPFATLTTWRNITSDQLCESDDYRKEFKALCDEFEQVAIANGVGLERGIYERNIGLVERSPKGSTSSMQRDYHSGRESEVESLTSYISHLGKQLGVATPTYDTASRELKSSQIESN